MNFDKFKNLKPQPIAKPQGADTYFEKLDSLKKRPVKNRVLSVTGTVAAAVAIVVIVSVWALLGHGIRYTDSVAPSASAQLHERVITDELYHQILSFYHGNYIFLIRDFDKDNPLTKDELIDYCEVAASDLRDDLVLSKEELSAFVYDMFRYEMDFDSDIEYDSPFSVNYSLTTVDIVSYSVSDTFNDGTQLAKIDIQGYDGLTTVTFIQRGDLVLEYLLSVKTDETKKAPTLESEFENIATKYCFDSMPQFEQGTSPDFLSAKYHIAAYLGKDKLVNFENGKISGQGIPMELFDKAADELYGGIATNDGYIALEGVNTVRFDTLGIIDIGNGQLVAPLEATGDLEVESYKFINAFGFEYQSKSAFRITYEVTYKNSSEPPSRYEICYVRSDNHFGLYPTQFISHKRL